MPHIYFFLIFLIFSLVQAEHLTYDVYLQLSHLRTGLQLIPYRTYELRWEIECTSDDRQPITKFPNAFAIDDSQMIFFDAQTRGRQQERQDLVYVRRVQEMAVVCFRLYFRNDLALEDCLVVDVRSKDFSDVRYSTKTRAHGNTLTYQAQVTPTNGLYLLLVKNENNETFLNGTTNTYWNSGCLSAIVIASFEAFVILTTAITGLCLYLYKSDRIEFIQKFKRKRRPFTNRTLQKKPVSKTCNNNKNHQQQPKIVTKQFDIRVNSHGGKFEQYYKAPSDSSGDSGLSSLKKSKVKRGQPINNDDLKIYDDPPGNFESRRTPPVQEFLAEIWRRNRPADAPPPPPMPDYRRRRELENEREIQNISHTVGYDLYDVLEDPNNWDPPEEILEQNIEMEDVENISSNVYSNDESEN